MAGWQISVVARRAAHRPDLSGGAHGGMAAFVAGLGRVDAGRDGGPPLALLVLQAVAFCRRAAIAHGMHSWSGKAERAACGASMMSFRLRRPPCVVSRPRRETRAGPVASELLELATRRVHCTPYIRPLYAACAAGHDGESRGWCSSHRRSDRSRPEFRPALPAHGLTATPSSRRLARALVQAVCAIRLLMFTPRRCLPPWRGAWDSQSDRIRVRARPSPATMRGQLVSDRGQPRR